LENKLNELNKHSHANGIKKLFSKFSSKPSETADIFHQLIDVLNTLENTCVICEKISYTMKRYMDVIYYLWQNEKEFKELMKNKKGFCLPHFKILLEGAKQHLSSNKQWEFLTDVLPTQMENMKRIQEEVNWFTKKFDYRNNDAPWGNSKDAVPRAIEKNVGFSRLEQE